MENITESQLGSTERIDESLAALSGFLCQSNTLSPSLIKKSKNEIDGLRKRIILLDQEHRFQLNWVIDLLTYIYYLSYFIEEPYPRITSLDVLNIVFKLNEAIRFARDKNYRAGEMAKTLKYILEVLVMHDRIPSETQRNEKHILLESLMGMYQVKWVKYFDISLSTEEGNIIAKDEKQLKKILDDTRNFYMIIKRVHHRYYAEKEKQLDQHDLPSIQETVSDETADYMPTAGLESTMDALPNNPDLIESRDVAEA